MTTATARLNPVIYGDQATCSAVVRDLVCGAGATLRLLVSCVHEHVRWIANCDRCGTDRDGYLGLCRVCYEGCGPDSHDCAVKVFSRRPLVVSS